MRLSMGLVMEGRFDMNTKVDGSFVPFEMYIQQHKSDGNLTSFRKF